MIIMATIKIEQMHEKPKDGQPQNYYEILGLGGPSDILVIEGAYQTLELMYAPDTDRGGTKEGKAKYSQIKKAYKLLSNPHARAVYDKALNQKKGHQQALAAASLPTIDGIDAKSHNRLFSPFNTGVLVRHNNLENAKFIKDLLKIENPFDQLLVLNYQARHHSKKTLNAMLGSLPDKNSEAGKTENVQATRERLQRTQASLSTKVSSLSKINYLA